MRKVDRLRDTPETENRDRDQRTENRERPREKTERKFTRCSAEPAPLKQPYRHKRPIDTIRLALDETGRRRRHPTKKHSAPHIPILLHPPYSPSNPLFLCPCHLPSRNTKHILPLSLRPFRQSLQQRHSLTIAPSFFSGCDSLWTPSAPSSSGSATLPPA